MIPSVNGKLSLFKHGASKQKPKTLLSEDQKIMKRYCKNIDITSVSFIMSAIDAYMRNRTKKERNRKDIRELYARFGTDEKIAEFLSQRFKWYRDGTASLPLEPILQKEIIDRGNGKHRVITVEGVIQQLYDQIAVEALKDAIGCLGYYQACCIKNLPVIVSGNQTIKTKGKGQKWAVGVISDWLKEPDSNWVVTADIKQNYASVPHGPLKAKLNRRIKNDDLITMIIVLLLTVSQDDPENPKGLFIGSVLSIYLDALYVSEIYHYMMEESFYTRHTKTGDVQIHTCNHCFIWVDDITLVCSSKRLAKKALADLKHIAGALGLTIKDNAKIIHNVKQPTASHKSYVDFVGYRIYSDHVTMRRRNYLAARKAFKKANREKNLSVKEAKTLMAYQSQVDISNGERFCKKYNVRKTCHKARRIISNYDKSNFQRKAGNSPDVHR